MGGYGYVLLDGSKLDFSGKHDGAPGGGRTVDHLDITDALGMDYGGNEYSDGVIQFMREGNIRISPESGGINLSVLPTKAQFDSLSDFISRNRGEVILDIDDENGNALSSTEYPKGTHANKVIADIKKYFETGETPFVSEVSKFRFSRELDSLGNNLSEEQTEYFKDFFSCELEANEKIQSDNTERREVKALDGEVKTSRDLKGGEINSNERTDKGRLARIERSGRHNSHGRGDRGAGGRVEPTYEKLSGKERGRVRRAAVAAFVIFR